MINSFLSICKSTFKKKNGVGSHSHGKLTFFSVLGYKVAANCGQGSRQKTATHLMVIKEKTGRNVSKHWGSLISFNA